MNAIQLQMPSGEPAESWACCKCKRAYQLQRMADDCCLPRKCYYCEGSLSDRDFSNYHGACRTKDLYEKAEKLTKWDGWVYCDGLGREYFSSVDEFLESIEGDEDEGKPAWVFVAEPQEFPGINLDSAIENMCEEMFEDAEDHLSGLDKLDSAVRAFNEANAGLITYMVNEKKVLLLTKEDRP